MIRCALSVARSKIYRYMKCGSKHERLRVILLRTIGEWCGRRWKYHAQDTPWVGWLEVDWLFKASSIWWYNYQFRLFRHSAMVICKSAVNKKHVTIQTLQFDPHDLDLVGLKGRYVLFKLCWNTQTNDIYIVILPLPYISFQFSPWWHLTVLTLSIAIWYWTVFQKNIRIIHNKQLENIGLEYL